MSDNELLGIAKEMRGFSYCKYSSYAVGAALLTKDGKVYTGCNVENGSYSLTNCAERTAFFNAISKGEREFSAIAIVGGDISSASLDDCTPCGACIQVISEFCEDDFRVITINHFGEEVVYTLAMLAPTRFRLKV